MLLRNISSASWRQKMLDVAYSLGVPTAYVHERNGQLFHRVWADPTRTLEKSTLGSHVALGLHTEMAFHTTRPSFVLLYCEANPHGVATNFVVVDDVLRRLTLREKRETDFKVHPPASYQGLVKVVWHPLLRNITQLVVADHCRTEFRTARAERVYHRRREEARCPTARGPMGHE